MIYSIDVLGAFDFLQEEILIGTLEYERVRGNASYRFAFDKAFLSFFGGKTLSADLGPFEGIQSAHDRIFSFIGDMLPDRWGRALINKRERIEAVRKGSIPRIFDDMGYLVRVDDQLRMGGLRFKRDGNYVGLSGDGMSVPPLATLDQFIRYAHEVEKSDIKQDAPVREEWLLNIWKQGSSLGGARPKVNVVDENGDLMIAKIPSVRDEYDIAIWEHFAATLASKAGINAAKTRLVKVGPTAYHTLLSKRFDRDGDKRIHFASSLTLTALRDGDGVDTGKGYMDIADAMAGEAGVSLLKPNLEELYRRIAFNILIGNSDDHFRNHGFLLRKTGWELSPAYDMNPSHSMHQSLLISPSSNKASIKELLDASDYYLIGKEAAGEAIRSVFVVVSRWREHATMIGIPKGECERFAERMDTSLEECRQVLGWR